MRSPNQIALELGLLKALGDHIKALTDERKAELQEGTRRGTVYATLESGGEVATVVSKAESSSSSLVVADREAFIEWVIQNRPAAIRASVDPTHEAAILAEFAKNGEMPEWARVATTTTKAQVSVSQTKSQRAELLEAWADGRLQPVAELLELTGEVDDA